MFGLRRSRGVSQLSAHTENRPSTFVLFPFRFDHAPTTKDHTARPGGGSRGPGVSLSGTPHLPLYDLKQTFRDRTSTHQPTSPTLGPRPYFTRVTLDHSNVQSCINQEHIGGDLCRPTLLGYTPLIKSPPAEPRAWPVRTRCAQASPAYG